MINLCILSVGLTDASSSSRATFRNRIDSIRLQLEKTTELIDEYKMRRILIPEPNLEKQQAADSKRYHLKLLEEQLWTKLNTLEHQLNVVPSECQNIEIQSTLAGSQNKMTVYEMGKLENLIQQISQPDLIVEIGEFIIQHHPHLKHNRSGELVIDLEQLNGPFLWKLKDFVTNMYI